MPVARNSLLPLVGSNWVNVSPQGPFTFFGGHLLTQQMISVQITGSALDESLPRIAQTSDLDSFPASYSSGDIWMGKRLTLIAVSRGRVFLKTYLL